MNQIYRIIGLLFWFTICPSILFSQVAPSKYWIQFTDKEYSSFSTDQPLDFLSQKAIDRRLKHSIAITEQDLPVSTFYTDSLEKLGMLILNTSRWLNAVTVFSNDQALLDTIHNLGFVAGKQKSLRLKSQPEPSDEKFSQKFEPVVARKSYSSDVYQYGASENQVKMLKGEFLHNLGFTGNNIHIAVIDAGFENSNTVSSLSHLFLSGRILGTRDFVTAGNSVYHEHQHGTNVLSVIGGNLNGQLIGTSPGASYWLLRSEDASSEYLIEEDNWVAAAEFADSAGVDIINTSLGYTIFDDPDMNHTYQDMDGKTTRISIAAGIAASKGMLIFVCAGNDGNKFWRYISAPADSDSALAIGAVNSSGNYVSFSSVGPSADGRIKPDLAAKGQGVVLQSASGAIVTGNGTSFSSPLVAGMAACLWQAFPELKAWEIKKAIVESASQFQNPDNLKGYGIPNFEKAYKLLDSSYIEIPWSVSPFKLYPNPFSEQVFIEALTDLPDRLTYKIFSLDGKLIFTGNIESMNYGEIRIINLPDHLIQGVYIIRLISKQTAGQSLLIKN
jgi:subtilisin family serine protease